MSEHRPPSPPAAPLPPPLPSVQPVLPYGSPATPADVSRAFPVQAAKFSLYAALFAFAINWFVVQGGRGMPAFGHLAIAALCLLMILSGFVLGVIALAKNRRSRLPGVTGYAVAGIAINGLFLAANAFLWSRLLLS